LESVELRGTDHGKDVGSIRKSAIFLVKALVHFLARKLGVKNSGVEIITGHLRPSVAAVRGEPFTLSPNPHPGIEMMCPDTGHAS